MTVVAIVDVDGGVGRGFRHRQRARRSTASRDLVRRAEELAPRGGTGRGRRPTSSTGIAASADWSDAPAVATSADFADLAPELGAMFAAGARRRHRALRLRRAGGDDRTTSARAPALRLRFADPEGRLELTAKSHGRSRSTWAGRAGRVARGDGPRARRPRAAPGPRVAGAPRRGRARSPRGGAHPERRGRPHDRALLDLGGARRGRRRRACGATAGGGTRVGETVADPRVHLFSDPAMPGSRRSRSSSRPGRRGSSSVFDNGLPVDAVSWIRDGVLGQPHHDPATRRSRPACRSVPAPTTCGSTSPAAAATSADVIAGTDDGLLVTCLWYNRVVDPQTLLLTGLTRDGVYVVRGGEVVGAVTNFRFNDSPVGVLGRIADAGAPVGTLGARDGRLLQPRGDAAAGRARLQLLHRLAGELSGRRPAGHLAAAAPGAGRRGRVSQYSTDVPHGDEAAGAVVGERGGRVELARVQPHPCASPRPPRRARRRGSAASRRARGRRTRAAARSRRPRPRRGSAGRARRSRRARRRPSRSTARARVR